jgi:hypothetical protein
MLGVDASLEPEKLFAWIEENLLGTKDLFVLPVQFIATKDRLCGPGLGAVTVSAVQSTSSSRPHPSFSPLATILNASSGSGRTL